MKIYTTTIFLCSLVSLLSAGCGGKTDSKTAATKLPWSRVGNVEVTSDTEIQQQPPTSNSEPSSRAVVGPGASQSEVILTWGVPDYILDSQSDPDRKIWQYPHAVVVFQGTKVEKVLPR